ncbi:subunit of endoplasmic reticulum translocation complex [Ordospora colligata]|uniref:Subunit of endoplasmic reticulum translocation complex n=1 Tax=Ordospora colligata OC4 TaxID=1354746 RepID=A0A0B2UFT0_9MICR|nr:subunit of endoplasmic reticulum translocation complex [Ordospora colligata OC4]KHN69941.1 subunit of endoplasmic reticulum translocation complex [Ordospora colligata OC4]TBU16111.1 subunit of endoplasmic reticulum translocation complex [Ordospora colligata]TBU16324.1 subunit of endoplasmic reticulum translocation complex [Ordospora colligata]TBU19028.1 subunit of endoplasmic reticulum translocation complex [Ordospora colligata]
MFLLIAVIISLIIVLYSLIKKYGRRERLAYEAHNTELEKYFGMKSDGSLQQVLLKQLTKAAAVFLERVTKLEKDMEVIGGLYENRMISEAYWEHMNKKSKNYELEKMCIESEANILKHGYGDEIFKDASKAGSSGSTNKKIKNGMEDALYLKKREFLESELFKRLETRTDVV